MTFDNDNEDDDNDDNSVLPYYHSGVTQAYMIDNDHFDSDTTDDDDDVNSLLSRWCNSSMYDP